MRARPACGAPTELLANTCVAAWCRALSGDLVHPLELYSRFCKRGATQPWMPLDIKRQECTIVYNYTKLGPATGAVQHDECRLPWRRHAQKPGRAAMRIARLPRRQVEPRGPYVGPSGGAGRLGARTARRLPLRAPSAGGRRSRGSDTRRRRRFMQAAASSRVATSDVEIPAGTARR